MKQVVAVLLLAFAGSGFAQDAPAQSPQGEPDAGKVLKDGEFGVTSRHFALQRRVEMFQWQRSDGGYEQVWSEEPIASSGFDARHRNPGEFPVQARFWVAEGASLDGKPLHDDVLKQFGAWRDFRPGFTALPGNLAATFQPEGDGLSSTENPLDPQIGDLRVTWREMRLPDLAGRVVLSQGVWVPDDATATAAPLATGAGNGVSDTDPRTADARPKWMMAAIALLAVALLLMLVSRRRGAGAKR